jgi:hypothetical protein
MPQVRLLVTEEIHHKIQPRLLIIIFMSLGSISFLCIFLHLYFLKNEGYRSTKIQTNISSTPNQLVVSRRTLIQVYTCSNDLFRNLIIFFYWTISLKFRIRILHIVFFPTNKFWWQNIGCSKSYDVTKWTPKLALRLYFMTTNYGPFKLWCKRIYFVLGQVIQY